MCKYFTYLCSLSKLAVSPQRIEAATDEDNTSLSKLYPTCSRTFSPIITYAEINLFGAVTYNHRLIFITLENTLHFYMWDAIFRKLVSALLIAEHGKSGAAVIKIHNKFCLRSYALNLINNIKLNPWYLVRLLRIL